MNFVVLGSLLPSRVVRIVVYLEPVDTRWGPDRLRALCQTAMGLEPDESTAFVFTNRIRDRLLMYCVDADGDRLVQKKLDKGAFLMPARDPDGKAWISMKPAMMSRLFRS